LVNYPITNYQSHNFRPALFQVEMFMSVSSPRIRVLLRQANRVAASGKRVAAENLYRQIVEEAPDAAPAWVGLAKVVLDPAEQEAALERALMIDPNNADAKIGLTALRNGQSVVEALNPEPEPAEKAAEPEPVTTAARFDSVQSRAETVEPVVETADEGLKAAEQGLEEQLEGAVVTEEALRCANHPNRLTHLRCNKCGKPVCAKCVRPTPVGYRCKSCEDVFYTATAVDYLIAAVIALPLGVVSGFIAGRLGFLVIFFAAFAGSVIARIVHRLIGRRRGRWMPFLVAAAVVIGGIVPLLPFLLAFLLGNASGLIGLIWPAIYIVIATSAAFYQMK
jgi:hypothetical protein